MVTTICIRGGFVLTMMNPHVLSVVSHALVRVESLSLTQETTNTPTLSRLQEEEIRCREG